MSYGDWKRDELTGLPLNQQTSSYSNQLRVVYPDCDIFCTKSFAALANVTQRTLVKVLEHPANPFHYYPNKNNWGPPIMASHTNSIIYGGLMWKQYQMEARRHRVVGWFNTDQTSGTRNSVV